MSIPRFTRRAIARLGALALGLAVTSIDRLDLKPVGAHAYYFKSKPALDEVLTEPINEVRVWFSVDVDPKGSWLRVFDANGARVDADDSRQDTSDKSLLIVGLTDAATASGDYRIVWRTLSTLDGHEAEDYFYFTLRR